MVVFVVRHKHMSAREQSFSGKVKVAARIIDYLSSGLYPSPAACLKELVNNSYDADATRVEVYVKPDANEIVIADNGVGMSRREFQTHFKRISESHKRDRGQRTASGRHKVGKIGIGLIAANELCDELEIYSTKSGSTELLHVQINFAAMRRPPGKRRDKSGAYVKADYVGNVTQTVSVDHYTRIYLKSIRGEAREILAGAASESVANQRGSLYGLREDSVASRLKDKSLSTWKQFDRYSETLLKVGLNVPVRYHSDWLPTRLQSRLRSFETAVKELDFTVHYDGSDLRKPIVFAPGRRRTLLREFKHRGDQVAARGYFYAQHGTIKPIELNGLLVRIRQAAVGEYDPTFWGFSHTEGALMQKWVSAEIWADDRLEDAMNIDRAKLRETHPAYVELRKAIHTHLWDLLADTRKLLYKRGSADRKAREAAETATDLRLFASAELVNLAPEAARVLSAAWSGRDQDDQATLLRRFSVLEVYRIVLDTAAEFLDSRDLAAFTKRLTERLKQ